ncbi:hypothetical protein DH2020_019060 [Rehmannia glutinosa]|uniref:RanBP2-type domain-containing protein n=1 Tax=Rehmannia glutinosa TaxID=99300 RepID=A0ABR0WKQ7_REHGL
MLPGPSILRNSCNSSHIPPLKVNKFCLVPSLRFKRNSSSALTLDFESSTLTTDSSAVFAHPWPEWVNFVDRLKTKGYITQNAALSENDGGVDNEGVAVYTEMKLVKDASQGLMFHMLWAAMRGSARAHVYPINPREPRQVKQWTSASQSPMYYVFRASMRGFTRAHVGLGRLCRHITDAAKSLSTQDIQTVVEKGCPNLFRKSVNSAKRLRAYLELVEGDVCSSCNLRGSCDRAYVMLIDSEAAARTVDVVRILLLYALDPLVISGEGKPPGRELVESSARKLLSQLVELGETHPDPDLPKPAKVTSQGKKQSLNSAVNRSSKNVEMKQGDWVCSKCNFMNFAKNRRCRSCGHDTPKSRGVDEEMKTGDWICPGCNFMNFAKNIRCLKCKVEGPKRVSVDEVERKKGDWNCPHSCKDNARKWMSWVKNLSSGMPNVGLVQNSFGHRCSFVNFASNRQCFRCQEQRPQRQLKPGEWECPGCDFLNFSRNTVCKKCNLDRPLESAMDQQTWKKPY